MTRRKYRKGEPVGSMVELVEHLEEKKHEARIYYNHKVQSYGWLFGMHYSTLWRAVRAGRLWYAVQADEGGENGK